MNSNVMEEYVTQLMERAAAGEADKVDKMIKGAMDVNVKNERGWTALMFAARNGHTDVVRVLMEKGCDLDILNSSGHTALDIAKFWNHQKVVDLMSPLDETGQTNQLLSKRKEIVNFFGGQFLDRAADKRKDNDWLKQRMSQETTKYVLLSDLKALSISSGQAGTASKASYRLCVARYSQMQKYLDSNPAWVFLGIEKVSGSGDIPWFAVDVTSWSEEELKVIHPQGDLLTPFPGGMAMENKDAAIFAQARSLLAWHDRYQFCPTCGAKSTIEEAGYKRQCTKDDCRSRKGIHNTSYPRLDPTAIMAVVSADGQRLLLGRGKRFPAGMFSCLAGFMEPGESIEDACRREVEEESGVRVGRVEYHSCQFWPMPCSLMIGCIAHATSEHIKIDKEELAEARWFTREDIIQMLNKNHPQTLFIPPEQAIAHTLIRAWLQQ